MTEREQLQQLVRALAKTIESGSLGQQSAPAIAAAVIKQIDDLVPGTRTALAVALTRPESVALPSDPFEMVG